MRVGPGDAALLLGSCVAVFTLLIAVSDRLSQTLTRGNFNAVVLMSVVVSFFTFGVTAVQDGRERMKAGAGFLLGAIPIGLVLANLTSFD